MSTASFRSGHSAGQLNTKPFASSSEMRNPASGRQAPSPPPPPEIPIANRQMPEDTLLTTSQAAAILRVSTETLKKWRQRPGRGPEFIRYPGGSVRYRLSTILKFLADSTVQP